MIRRFMVAFLLIVVMSAQDTQAPRIRIVFREGHFERSSIKYALHDPATRHWRLGGGSASMHADRLSFEIQAETDRFRALVWAPGCKMKHFDPPVEKSNIDLQFTCDPLSTVPFHGRIEGVDVGESAKISIDYVSLGTLFWLYDMKGEWAGSFGAPEVHGIAIAAIARDGTFDLELPDFSADPIVSDSVGELAFRIHGLKDVYILRPQPAEGIVTRATSIEITRSYPSTVTFMAVPLRDFR